MIDKMERDEAIEAIKVQTEKVVKLLPYKIDVEVKPTNNDDEVEVFLHYQEPIKKIIIETELK